MTRESRRSPRYPFFASVEITDTRTRMRLTGRTSELSLHGCYFDMMNPLPVGNAVKIVIRHEAQIFEAAGHVIYSQSNVGMGVAFDEVQVDHQVVLEAWMSKLGP